MVLFVLYSMSTQRTAWLGPVVTLTSLLFSASVPAAGLFPPTAARLVLLQDGLVADDSPNMQFMPSQNGKFPPSNSALPNHVLSSLTGLSVQSLNSVRQVRLGASLSLDVQQGLRGGWQSLSRIPDLWNSQPLTSPKQACRRHRAPPPGVGRLSIFKSAREGPLNNRIVTSF